MSVIAILPVIMTPITMAVLSLASVVATDSPKVNVCYYKEGTWKALRISEGELDAYKVEYKAFGYMGPTEKGGEPDKAKCNEWCAQNVPKDRETPKEDVPKEKPEEKPETKTEEPVKPYEAPKPNPATPEPVLDTTGK